MFRAPPHLPQKRQVSRSPKSRQGLRWAIRWMSSPTTSRAVRRRLLSSSSSSKAAKTLPLTGFVRLCLLLLKFEKRSLREEEQYEYRDCCWQHAEALIAYSSSSSSSVCCLFYTTCVSCLSRLFFMRVVPTQQRRGRKTQRKNI